MMNSSANRLHSMIGVSPPAFFSRTGGSSLQDATAGYRTDESQGDSDSVAFERATGQAATAKGSIVRFRTLMANCMVRTRLLTNLVRSGRNRPRWKTASPALQSCPQKRGVCTRVHTST
jgi:hypothetical protein